MRNKNHLGRLTAIAVLAWVPIIWICLAACLGTPDVVAPDKNAHVIKANGWSVELYDVTIEGCDYYYIPDEGLCHKGNCNNPIHQNQCK